MDGKVCSKCEQSKKLDDFYKDKSTPDGLRYWCKKCSNDYNKKYREENEESIKQTKKEYYYENQEEILERKRKYREENKEEINRKKREYRKRPEVKKRISEYNKKQYQKNREEILAKKKSHENSKRRRERERKRREEDEEFRIINNLRKRVGRVVKGEDKSDETRCLLGCSFEYFKQHLENQFEEGMSWDNYGYNGWHIDHEIPISFFDMTDRKQQKVCFHYSNMQPLWAEDNFDKNTELPNLFKGIELDKEFFKQNIL